MVLTVDDIDIRAIAGPEDLSRVVRLFNQVWGSITPLVGVELLRAIEHAGGYVAGAFHGHEVVGGSLAFLARHDGDAALHSHITGVLPGVRHTGLGRAMKLHQRAWAAERDLRWITWTFDPLVRRNAWFNLGVLGAQVHEYLVDFYGPIDDTINGRDASDRLLVAWQTSGPLPDDAGEGSSAPAEPGTVTVSTPDDIVVLRRTDRPAATDWRLRMRRELGDRLAGGSQVVGFTRDGNYLVHS